MTTHAHETEIIIDPDVPAVRIVREFDAPPERVFQAHADPDLFKQWIGPKGYETHIDTFECRTGGAYRWSQSNAAEGFEGWFRGTFHDVRPNELIIQTFTYEGMPDDVSLDRLVFEAIGDGRTRLTATSLVDSFEGRNAFVASGMEQGVIEGYEKLDEVLAAG